MCTPFPKEELVTIRDFLACKDPNDTTNSHTFSYFVDDEDRKIAEEILDTSLSSPWEMIRSLTFEDAQGKNDYRKRMKQSDDEVISIDNYCMRAALPPSDAFQPKVLTRGPTEAATGFNKAVLNHGGTTHQTNSAKASPHWAGNMTRNGANQGNVRLGDSETKDYSSVRPMPAQGYAPSLDGDNANARTASSMGIQLMKVFENDEYVTFKKIYPRQLEQEVSTALLQRSDTEESRGQPDSRTLRRRETREDPDGDTMTSTDVVSESSGIASSGARQVLIVISSKKNEGKSQRSNN